MDKFLGGSVLVRGPVVPVVYAWYTKYTAVAAANVCITDSLCIFRLPCLIFVAQCIIEYVGGDK